MHGNVKSKNTKTTKTLDEYLKCIKNFKRVLTIKRYLNAVTGCKWCYIDFPVSFSTSLIGKCGCA